MGTQERKVLTELGLCLHILVQLNMERELLLEDR